MLLSGSGRLWLSVLVVLGLATPVRAELSFGAEPIALGPGELHLEPVLPWQGLDAELEVSRQALTSHDELFGGALAHEAFGFERRTSLLGSLDVVEPMELWDGRSASVQARFAYDAVDRIEQPLLARRASSETTPTFSLRAELGGLALEGELARTFSARDDAASTRGRAQRSALRAELAPHTLLGDAVPYARWLPKLRAGFGSTDSVERALTGRFGAEERSASAQDERSLGVEWSGSHWLLGLGWSESAQSSGSSPTVSEGHQLTLGAWRGDALSLWLSLARASERSADATKRQLSGSLALDWRLAPGWKLAASLSPSWERKPGFAARRWTATTALAWDLPLGTEASPAHAALRFTRSRSVEREAASAARESDWTLGLAVVIPTF